MAFVNVKVVCPYCFTEFNYETEDSFKCKSFVKCENCKETLHVTSFKVPGGHVEVSKPRRLWSLFK